MRSLFVRLSALALVALACRMLLLLRESAQKVGDVEGITDTNTVIVIFALCALAGLWAWLCGEIRL